MNVDGYLTSLALDLRANKPPSSPATDTYTKWLAWLNEGHRKILRTPGLTQLRQAIGLTITSVAGQKIYALPYAFERLDGITDTNNQRRLRERTIDWFRSVDPGDRSTGNPWVQIPWGIVPVLQQPAATGLWAVSSAAGDTTQTVNLVGIRANGDPQRVTATLNGTTRVAIGTPTDFVQVVSWDLSATATGAVQLYDAAAAGNLLARIPIGKQTSRYQTRRLWPTPAGAITYQLDGQLVIPDLAVAGDEPLLPESFHDLLLCYVRWRQYKQDNDDRKEDELAEFDAQLGQLMSYVNFDNAYQPVQGRERDDLEGWNNLGGDFPADGWGR